MKDKTVKKKRSYSLRELAGLAGADISTVSRALNHDPRISAERGDKIRKLAEKVGYRPRPLRSKLTKSIGILISTEDQTLPKEDFLRRISWLAQCILGEMGLHVNIENISRGGGAGIFLPELVRQNRVDGVILAGFFSQSQVENIRRTDIPITAINDSSERLGVPCVRSNPAPAIRQLITTLAAKGHEQFAYINTDLNYPTVRSRHETYVETLKSLGIGVDKRFDISGLSEGVDGGVEGVRMLMKHEPMPSAILCCNDWMALGAMQELQRNGVRIPDDVSIAGHDNMQFCDELEPKLTSVHRDETEMVRQAIDLLMGQIEDGNREMKDILIDGKIVWRESAGIAPGRLVNVNKSIKMVS
ncbi:MAG: LacI family DNA-binding transcriptional regulator [Victivallales bacterium]|jgi:DNA-binding LacI/PurR family transcriptional regulator